MCKFQLPQTPTRELRCVWGRPSPCKPQRSAARRPLPQYWLPIKNDYDNYAVTDEPVGSIRVISRHCVAQHRGTSRISASASVPLLFRRGSLPPTGRGAPPPDALPDRRGRVFIAATKTGERPPIPGGRREAALCPLVSARCPLPTVWLISASQGSTALSSCRGVRRTAGPDKPGNSRSSITNHRSRSSPFGLGCWDAMRWSPGCL